MANNQKIGWVGVGRMGYQMAERLIQGGHDVSIWNRTKSKAEPLAKLGGKVVDKLADLADVDILFAIVSEGKDLEEVYFGPNGIVTTAKGKLPKIFVDCSSISVEDFRAHSRPAEGKERRIRLRAGVGQWPRHQSRQAVRGRFRPGSAEQDGYADHRSVRSARRVLCR